MKLFLHTSFHKKRLLNPQRVWRAFCIGYIAIIIALLGYFSWYFLQTTQTLDAPATPTLESNASKIQSMQKTLDSVESAVSARTGV